MTEQKQNVTVTETFFPMGAVVSSTPEVRMYGKPRVLTDGWNQDSLARAERLKRAYGEASS